MSPGFVTLAGLGNTGIYVVEALRENAAPFQTSFFFIFKLLNSNGYLLKFSQVYRKMLLFIDI